MAMLLSVTGYLKMNQQQQLYQQVKAERNAYEEEKRRKELGLFNKQEVHNLVASALVDFLNTLNALQDEILVGYHADFGPLMKVVEEFQTSRCLDPHYINPNIWSDEIKK